MFLHLITDEDKKKQEARSKAINDFIQKELLNKVFHITSTSNLACIKLTGFIKSASGNENFGQSRECFARRNKWISLFDFRNKTEEQTSDTTNKCLYLLLDKLENPVALILRESCYSKLKYQKKHTDKQYSSNQYLSLEKILETGGTYVPYTECWYPGDMPYAEIVKNIETNFPPQSEKIKDLYLSN